MHTRMSLLRGTAIALGCAALAACVGHQSRSPEGSPTPGLTVGETRIVGTLGEGQGVTCPTSLGRLNEMVKSAASGDQDAYQEAVEDAEILREGQRVRVLEVDDPQHVELSLVGGPDAGVSCWTSERDGLLR